MRCTLRAASGAGARGRAAGAGSGRAGSVHRLRAGRALARAGARSGASRAAEPAGQQAGRRGSTVSCCAGSRRQPFANSFRVSLSIPGEVVLAAHRVGSLGQPGGHRPGMAGTLNVECPRPGARLAAVGGCGRAGAAAGGAVPAPGRPVRPARHGRPGKEAAGFSRRSESCPGRARSPAARGGSRRPHRVGRRAGRWPRIFGSRSLHKACYS